MCTYNGKKYTRVGSGARGYFVIPFDEDDPNRGIKYPVYDHEAEMTQRWVDAASEYSAGPVTKVLVNFRGEETEALEMAYLKDDLRHRRATEGEYVLTYMMLTHCVLLAGSLKIEDTGGHNCVFQGKDERFRIFLIDMGSWSFHNLNAKYLKSFRNVARDFLFLRTRELELVHPFIIKLFKNGFTDQELFITELVKSCSELSSNFLCKDASVNFHERIDALMEKIEKDAKTAIYKLKAMEVIRTALDEDAPPIVLPKWMQ